MKNQIFEVDIKGLRQLQAGKPMWFIIRELLQNAMDEDITTCDIFLSHGYGKAHITVVDDSPTGFRDLADTYTLFKETYKREDVKKRGRFNFGEKQVLCLCDEAKIVSTTGAIHFDILKGIRTKQNHKSEKGSSVHVEVRMTKEEFQECVDYCKEILVPENIKFNILIEAGNENIVLQEDGFLTYKVPSKIFTASLKTEVKEDDQMRTVTRETNVHLHEPANGTAYIYELGIPICEIDCKYSIDVQQKVPLSADRDKVDGKYLKDLYALVLNNMIDEVDEEVISQTWIRAAVESNKIDADTVQEIKNKRFGEKAVIENPFDDYANDEALANGYRVIRARELSTDEREKMKQYAGLTSSSAKFSMGTAPSEEIDWQPQHTLISILCKKIAKDFLGIDYLTCSFFTSKQVTIAAQYGNRRISFNTTKLSDELFHADEAGYVKVEMLDLIAHELAHEKGNHTEHSYHDCLTRLCARFALTDKKYFKLK